MGEYTATFSTSWLLTGNGVILLNILCASLGYMTWVRNAPVVKNNSDIVIFMLDSSILIVLQQKTKDPTCNKTMTG